MSFAKNIFYMFVVQVSNYIAPLAVLPFLTRVLGPENFGKMAVIYSICAVSMVISDYGFSLSGTNYVSRNRNDKRKIGYYIYSVFIIKIIISIAILLLILLYLIEFSNFESIFSIFSVLTVIILSQTFQFTWFYQGIEKMKAISIYSLISKLTYVSLVFFFVRNDDDVMLVLWSYAFSQVLSSLISLFGVYKLGFRFKRTPLSHVIEVAKNGGLFFISRLSVTVYTTSNTILISNFSGLAASGIYSSAEKLYQAGQNVTSPVTQVLFPTMVRKKCFKYLFKIVFSLYIPILISCIVSYIYAEEIMTIFFGEEFRSGADTLRLLMILLSINFLNANLGYPAFAIIDKLNQCNLSVIIGSITHFGILFGIWVTFGINSVSLVYALIITELIVFSIRLGFLLNENRLRKKVG
ncbi:oligosaccharide flippase family protein [Vibrio parahaemolyticus]|uniref:oligosaccharide flippase family protein n=1 Tax=Vibrio parahaemolyticus TaxID=670 RepID=UPI00226B1E27|nr:oligosaccharide flippase family protein [Vibrio parahaemolyticus]MCX8854936.1 oligosaccharide flippase family protein [Vibrio parahaemolyticus]